jgi:hypothetical protein
MSTISPPSKTNPHAAPRLHVSRFDHFAGMLIALLILFGTAVPAMFFIVMASQTKKVQEALPVTFIETGEGSGRGDHEAGTARGE